MKRLLCILLALVMLTGLLPAAVLAEDEPAMKVSDYMLDIIKDFEGFRAEPYWDYSQWSVGYGTTCGKNPDGSDIPAEIKAGITEEQAHTMLIDYLATHAEKEVNAFYAKLGRTPTQQQFDAIVDFTYNVGGSWMYSDTKVRQALENNANDLELMRALGAWCRTGNVNSTLCGRRIRDMLIYQYGYYVLPYGKVDSKLKVVETGDLPLYRYVIYHGEGATLNSSGYSDTVEYFKTDGEYGTLLKPTLEGKTFEGWYDDDGDQLLETDWVRWNLHVYARWDNFPSAEGKVFGGWYADEEFTQPLEPGAPTAGAHYKMVDEDVLSVKWQIGSNTTDKSETTNLRLLTTVDSLQYKSVGFIVETEGKPARELTSSTVYQTIYGYADGNNESYKPTIFSEESQYFMAHTLTGIPNSAFGSEITVTPKWETLDGTVIKGKPLTFKINEAFIMG